MTAEQPLISVDIHTLIEMLTELKDTIVSERKVNVKLLSDITRQLTGLQETLSQFCKDSSELLRLLRCCLDFLTASIRGMSCVVETCIAIMNFVFQVCSTAKMRAL